jgi:Tol biopolymer transport system component
MSADGSHKTVLLNLSRSSGPWVYSPVWSPDGKSIALDDEGSEIPALWVINATTGARTATIPGGSNSNELLDWQALPGGHPPPRWADTAKPLPAPL